VPSLRHTLATRANRYQHFLPLLAHSTNPEDPIPLLTAAFLTELVSASLVESPSSLPSPSSSSSSKHSSQDDAALPQLYTYLSTLARSHDAGLQDIGIRGFSTLLRTSRSRQIFWAQRRETVAPLVALLRTAAGTGGTGPLSSSNTSSSSSSSTTTSSAAALRDGGGPISNRTNEATGTNGANAIGVGIAVQLLYHVLLVIWQLTFEAGLVGEQLESDYDIIALYIALLRISPKEKTTRLILATLHNLFSAHRDLLLPGAVFNRLPALLATIKARHLTDPDLQADLAALIDMLAEYTAKQTTFTQYAAEVRSGHLHWSPPHRSPQFWRENARRILDADQGALPRKLAEILARDWESDKAVLEIACNDVGCLVKEAPEKRGQLEKLGIKARVMQLMSDPDPAVRWESLKATGEWLRYSIEA
ncbi:H(+)-transporting V1 sector ATPase subunit H, partial [Ascosphaera acerosa]